MKFLLKLSFNLVVIAIFCKESSAQTSTLVSLDAFGKLQYTADSKGNRVPDFSGVGYMNSESPIPTVAVVKTVYPVAGDNLLNVQSAINEVSALPLDAAGFRGAILFKSGTYNVSDTIKIKASGIVLRGEGYTGSGTNFIATKAAQHVLFYFCGTSGTTNVISTKKAITDAYLPIGTKQVTVASGHSFVIGDKVFIHRIPNSSWISLLGMNLLSQLDPAATNWTASAYDMYSERKVTGVSGNVISLDAPIMDIIDPLYATGELSKYNSARIEKCGLENMRISSIYASETDENHGWDAVEFDNLVNGWCRDMEAYYFGYSAVNILDGAAWVTVDNCKMLDAKSTIDGGRRYSFNIDGQRSLVKNCFTRNGRHDFVNGSRTCGPNVFYNCTATLQNNDIGPHHRWSTGILFDNISANGRMNVQNRTTSGSGHGWAGAQIMFWNCNAVRMVVQDPQGDARNWAIGCVSPEITNVGDMTTEPLGIVESQGIRIAAIPSLFLMQLNERIQSVLPVDITSFTAKAASNTVLLNWSTASEKNNDIFYIQQSVDAVEFKKIGQIKGNGNTNQKSNYQFEHLSPSLGINYYRLMQVDLDGKQTYSPTRSVVFRKKGLSLHSTFGANYIEVSTGTNVEINVLFYSNSGQQLLSEKVVGKKQINISSLPSGTYLIKTSEGEMVPFIKK